MPDTDERRVLIVEDKHDGHYLYYVRLLVLEALDRGHAVVLATAPGLPTTREGAFYLTDVLDRITVVELDHCTPQDIAMLATALSVERTVVPDADLWLSPLARLGGWHGPGRLELLVLRSSTQPRPVPGVQAARTGLKRALMARIAAMPDVRLSVLRSSIWHGRSPLPATRDPITLSATGADVEAFAEAAGLDVGRTWFAVLGNITDRKNLPMVAAAVARVAQTAPVGLLVAGKVEAGQLAQAQPALDRIAATGAVRVVDRMLGEEELDAAVACVDCLVLAHSNEGPSGMLAKAAATGTRVLTAGARSLRADARQVPTIAAWTRLDVDRLAEALRMVPGRPRPRPVVPTGTSAFTDSLLGRRASPLRVLWCSPSYGYGGDLAYFEAIFRDLSARFPSMTIPVVKDFPVERYPDLPLRPILQFRGAYGAYGRGGRLIPTAGSMLRMMRLRPQVVIGIEFTPLSVIAMLLARIVPGRRRVLLLLESDPSYRGTPPSPRVVRAKRLLAALAHVVMANSDLARQYALDQLRLPPAKVVRASYLTSQPLRGRERRSDTGVGPRSVLFANSLVARKGAAELLRAYAALPGSAQVAGRLDVVGDGEDRAELEGLARQLGVEDLVTFHGHVPYRELHRYYGRADIVVAPSLADYRSLSAIEAAATGLPSIVSIRDGAHPELARSGAFVIDPTDTVAFSAALAALLVDDEEYSARAATARAHRDEHAVERVVDDLTALILDRSTS